MPTATMAAIVHYALEKYAVELREVPRPGRSRATTKFCCPRAPWEFVEARFTSFITPIAGPSTFR